MALKHVVLILASLLFLGTLAHQTLEPEAEEIPEVPKENLHNLRETGVKFLDPSLSYQERV